MNLNKWLSNIYEESCRLHNEQRISEAIFTSEQIAVQSLNILGLDYCQSKHYEKAIRCFDDAIKIDPGNWLLWSNLAHISSIQDDFARALTYSYKSINYAGGTVFDPYYNTGVILQALGETREAEKMYEIALKFKPTDPQTNYNLALCCLKQGNFEKGWNLYENRFETNKLTNEFKNRFLQPHWDGRRFKNKTLLVYSEQGLGDFIFFARFLPLVKKLGGKIICEVQEPLASVIGKNLKIEEIHTRKNNTDWPKPPESDYCASICSLPKLLKIHSLEQIPNKPYISTIKKSTFKNNKINIGLCWCGNPDHPRDHTRSIPLETFKPLAISQVNLYNLVKGVPGERNWPKEHVNLNKGIESFPMTDLSNEINDFNDLAHVVANLDLIITVDTGLSHLAGAMGKPVWTLLGLETDWRWMDKEISHWYPSMKLFRRKDTWENVIKDVLESLRTWRCQ